MDSHVNEFVSQGHGAALQFVRNIVKEVNQAESFPALKVLLTHC
jgi:hypothetical protein